MRRVVVTGIGQISPVGNTIGQAWENVREGRSGIGPITRFDASGLSCRVAGEVKDFDVSQFMSPRDARRCDPVIHYGVAAAFEAIRGAGLDDFPGLNPEKVGINIGTGIGGLEFMERNVLASFENPKRVNPFFIPGTISNMIAGHISIEKGYRGVSYGIVSACATGTHSIGDSADIIRLGRADVMIAGGAEASICRTGLAGFAACRALTGRNDDPEGASRPFDKDRDGFVMGEGSGVMVLEELEHAKARGAEILAEVLGYGFSSDAHHITAPLESGEGAALSMRAALKDAKIGIEDVDYVNAHGTSTPLGDVAEAIAIRKVFGDRAGELVISSTKSMTGHLLGGAGGVEAIYTVLAIQNRVAPPTINLENPDVGEGRDLDFCAKEARDLEIDVAISNSFGFGGTNATLVFGKYRG